MTMKKNNIPNHQKRSHQMRKSRKSRCAQRVIKSRPDWERDARTRTVSKYWSIARNAKMSIPHNVITAKDTFVRKIANWICVKNATTWFALNVQPSFAKIVILISAPTVDIAAAVMWREVKELVVDYCEFLKKLSVEDFRSNFYKHTSIQFIE